MKKRYKYFSILCSLLIGICFLYSSCEDYDYKTDYSWLDNVSSVNIGGAVDGTLPINLYKPEKLTLTLDPEQELDMRTFILTTSDSDIFTVTLTGDLEPKGLGTAKLIVKHRISDKLITSCEVLVWSDLEDIIAKTDPVLLKIGTDVNLNDHISLVPAQVDNNQLEFESLNPDIVTINKDGNMTGLKEGMAEIKVTAAPDRQGVSLTRIFNIQVKDKILVSRIELYGNQGKTVDIEKLDVVVDQQIDIAANLYVDPENADIKDVIYSIDNAAVATIDENGLMKIVGKGTAILTIKSIDGSNITKTVNIDSNGTRYARNFWGITTKYPYTPDGTTTGFPEHMVDDKADTFMSIGKPGSTAAPEETECYFTLDLTRPSAVNYFRMRHRDAGRDQLKVWEVTIQGSNDGENFTDIVNNYEIVSGKSTTIIESEDLMIPKTTYRYYRFYLTDWKKTTGNNMQIAELYLGIK